MDNIEGLYSKIIMDHHKAPRGTEEVESYTHRAISKNTSCGDEVTLKLRRDKGEIVQAIQQQSEGCIICRASASILAEQVEQLNFEQALFLIREVEALIHGETNVQPDEVTQEASFKALAHLRDFPTRHRCGLLAWETLEKILLEEV